MGLQNITKEMGLSQREDRAIDPFLSFQLTLEQLRNNDLPIVSKDSKKTIKQEPEDGIKKNEQYLKGFLNCQKYTLELEKKISFVEMQYIETLQKKHPSLSKTDLKHALLFKLQFTLKESAKLLNIEPTTVSNARHRMMKKLKPSIDMPVKLYLRSL